MNKYAYIGAIILTSNFFALIIFLILAIIIGIPNAFSPEIISFLILGSAMHLVMFYSLTWPLITIVLILIHFFIKKRNHLKYLLILSVVYLISFMFFSTEIETPIYFIILTSIIIGFLITAFWYRKDEIKDMSV